MTIATAPVATTKGSFEGLSEGSSLSDAHTDSVARVWRSRVALLVALAVSATYVAWHLGRGWVPHDEGTLGQSAERVLAGQLSHRDFDDPYTGLLALIDAAGFRVLGTSLWTLRLVMFGVFLAWVPTVFYVASRFVKPAAAVGMTLLVVVWSVPNYPAAMPSWYNLFLATFGVAALLRYLEHPRARWLVMAGIAGGLSFLIKVVGLYYVAGVLLFLVFRAQEDAHSSVRPADAPTSRGYAALVSGALALFVLALVALVRRRLGQGELFQFVLPGTVLAGLLAYQEWRVPRGPSQARFLALVRLLTPFLAGVALPIAVFLVPYALSGALGAFVNGVFVQPTKRFGFAAVSARPFRSLVALMFVAAIAVGARHAPRQHRRILTLVLALAALVLLVHTGRSDELYRIVWAAMRDLLPVLTILGAVVLSRRRASDAAAPLLRQQAMALLTVAAMFNLIQFPFAAPVYFCYIAPFVVLTALALLQYLGPVSRGASTVVLGFVLLFGVVRVNTSRIDRIGTYARSYGPVAPLQLPRAGIRVWAPQAIVYHQLIPMLQQRARGGYTWASPDCPEMYFLAGLQNPTRTMYDFFDDPQGRTARVLEAIERHGVTAIVLNGQPEFSPALRDDLVAELERRFPFAANVGPFQLRWRT